MWKERSRKKVNNYLKNIGYQVSSGHDHFAALWNESKQLEGRKIQSNTTSV